MALTQAKSNRLLENLDWGTLPPPTGQGYFIVVREKSGAMKSGIPVTNPRTQDRGVEIISREHELALPHWGTSVYLESPRARVDRS